MGARTALLSLGAGIQGGGPEGRGQDPRAQLERTGPQSPAGVDRTPEPSRSGEDPRAQPEGTGPQSPARGSLPQAGEKAEVQGSAQALSVLGENL